MGAYIVVEGIDGSGKGNAIDGIISTLIDEGYGKKVFDIDLWHKTERFFPSHNPSINLPGALYWCHHPLLHDDEIKGSGGKTVIMPRTPSLLESYIVTFSEPLFGGAGADTRFEATQSNGRNYTAAEIAELYSATRTIALRRIVIPLLEAGKFVIASRNLASSLVYQTTDSERKDGLRLTPEILVSEEHFPGNYLAMNVCPPDLLLIQIIEQQDAESRLKKRNDKNDACEFETTDFQKKISKVYQEPWLREMFEKVGTHVAYIDSSRNAEDVRKDCAEKLKEFLSKL